MIKPPSIFATSKETNKSINPQNSNSMKTLVLSVVIAMTSVLNTVSGNNLPEFAYNTTTNGEQVESQTVYTVENGKYLHPHLKYNYTYNADGSVSKKEVLKWSEIMQVFEK